MRDLILDLRHSLRQLRQSPGFTLAAVVCLALGIGANTAVFTYANAILLRGLPVAEPERLVRLYVSWESGLAYGSFSYPDLKDLQRLEGVFTGVVGSSLRPMHLTADGRSERLWGALVSADYFSVLGVEPALGRGFLAEEESAAGGRPVVVLSHGLWQRRYAGDPGIVGANVTLNGHPFTVVGVAPEGFTGIDLGLLAQLWVPITQQAVIWPGYEALESRGMHWVNSVMGRLEPGVTVAEARAAVATFMAVLERTYPDSNTGKAATVLPEAESSLHPLVRDSFTGFLALLFAVVSAVLLLACANVAGLLLARAAGRRREIAVRLALGAGRWRLLRQLLTESLTLALLAGAAGLLLAQGLKVALGTLDVPVDLPVELQTPLDAWVLGFTLLASVATGVLFGLAPAWQTSHLEPSTSLKEGGLARGGRASRLRRALVVAQVALSLVLLIAAGLALRSLSNASRIDVGFAVDHQLMASMDVGLQGYSEEEGRQLYRTLGERVAALPGVEAVGYAQTLPLALSRQQNGAVPEGFQVPEGSNPPSIDFNAVSPGYFDAMGIPIFQGRGFDAGDRQGSPPVLVVNQTFARRYWPGESAIGKRVETLGEAHEVVGVVKDCKYFSLGETPMAFMYYSLDQYYWSSRTLHLRTVGDPSAAVPMVRREIQALDRDLPIYNLQPAAAQVGFALAPARLAATVVAVFAALALLLAAVGLYGIIAYWVARGRREIGIRMALGAEEWDVLRMVLGQGLRLTAVGLALGLVMGVALAVPASRVLYGVRPEEPGFYLLAAGVLTAAALLAAFLPARRAVRVDPMTALRSE